DISEQHRDLVAVTVGRRPGGENLSGKVLRGITLGRSKAGIIRDGLQRMATLGAELGCNRYPASTLRTGLRQRSGALLAELCLSDILVLALGASHWRP